MSISKIQTLSSDKTSKKSDPSKSLLINKKIVKQNSA